MGAKGWMIAYAQRDVASVLRERPSFDRAATERLVHRLFPDRVVTAIADTSLGHGNPPDDEVYAAVWPGASLVCAAEVGIDRPSTLDRRFLDAGAGSTVYLHAMHSVVDWFAFAVWEADGQLRRALSVSPDDGVIENLGDPMPFELPFWAGEHPAVDPEDDDDDDPYPLAFHPLELGEEALGTLFGFVYEGPTTNPAVLDPEDVPLAAFALAAPRRRLLGRRR
jgi:hypothetical protein